ncbi:MAG: Ig-like domain-containing protein [Oscillospiraceae bacterium]|nr:Ig-like domain-containing protein [Oscillospiraceae bacterium]MBR6617138.1 Ig-like domain-containing protein [Oscillospiraceae bacterium]
MKRNLMKKAVAIAASALLAFGCSLPAFADSSRIPVLKIEQVSVVNETEAAFQDIAIAVTISDHTDGFLATSFGIYYDPALGLTEVKHENAAGFAHSYGSNGEQGIIWFSGASGNPKKTANTASTETMFTLYFALPEDAAPGTEYPINFIWDAPNSSTAYWHRADRTNIIGDIKATAINGGISLPDPNAPKLNKDYLELSCGDTAKLSASNVDGDITWICDNTNIATVKNGTITAVNPGSCTIYALTGNTSLKCSVLVTRDVSYDITKSEVIYIRNKKNRISLCCPENMNFNSIVWLSNNTEVVTVEKGVLTPVADGAASVFALYGNTIYETIVIVELQEETTADTEPEIPVQTETPTDEVEFVYGDVNEDGLVDILDCIVLNRNLMGVSPLTETQQQAADIYKDDRITPMDSLCILKYVLSLLNTVPVTP